MERFPHNSPNIPHIRSNCCHVTINSCTHHEYLLHLHHQCSLIALILQGRPGSRVRHNFLQIPIKPRVFAVEIVQFYTFLMFNI